MNIINRIFIQFRIPSALLHKVNTSCGRPLVLLIFGTVLLTVASCSQDAPVNPMPQFYQESQNLITTDFDSTNRFCEKFRGYLKKSPEATSDELYKPTYKNMRNAYNEFGYDVLSFGAHVCILIKYAWESDTTIYID